MDQQQPTTTRITRGPTTGFQSGPPRFGSGDRLASRKRSPVEGRGALTHLWFMGFQNGWFRVVMSVLVPLVPGYVRVGAPTPLADGRLRHGLLGLIRHRDPPMVHHACCRNRNKARAFATRRRSGSGPLLRQAKRSDAALRSGRSPSLDRSTIVRYGVSSQRIRPTFP
jgi:hypothetical protein